MRCVTGAEITAGSTIFSNFLVLKTNQSYMQVDPAERERRQAKNDIAFYDKFWVGPFISHCLAKLEF